MLLVVTKGIYLQPVKVDECRPSCQTFPEHSPILLHDSKVDRLCDVSLRNTQLHRDVTTQCVVDAEDVCEQFHRLGRHEGLVVNFDVLIRQGNAGLVRQGCLESAVQIVQTVS